MSEGKVLLMLGASSDIGYSLIEKVHGNYDKIIAHYNTNRETLEKLNKLYNGKLDIVQADLCDVDSVQGLLNYIVNKEIYADHIVHLAAEKVVNEKFHKVSVDSFVKLYNCQVLSLVKILKKNLPYMISRKEGKIAVMLSSYTHNEPPAFLSSYVTVKYALLGLVKSLAVEYAAKGISVNAVSPEMTDTKFLSDLPELVVQMGAEKNVMGRNLKIEEVVPTFEYLLSDAADCVTGQNILISGVRRKCKSI